MSLAGLAALGGVAFVAVGCTCGGDRRVPTRSPRPSAGPSAEQVLLPLEASNHPDGTHLVDVDGSVVRIEQGSIRASARFDFDRDGDRDALFLVLDAPNARARLFYGEQRGGAVGPLVSLASLASFHADANDASIECAATTAELVPLSDAIVLARVEARCEDAERPRRSFAWIVSADERPRALELLRFAGQLEGEGLAFRAEDRDHDGRDDVEVEVRVITPSEPATTTLVWMNRPSGLAREGSEPDPTFTALADRAAGLLEDRLDASLEVASRAIALREAICRDAERPRLWIGNARGVPCDASASIGRAYAVRAAALARRLRALDERPALDAALEAFIQLDRSGAALRAGDRALARMAWMHLASVPPPTLSVRRYPAPGLAASTAEPRLSVLAFAGEDQLLVRGSTPRALRVRGDTLEPVNSTLEVARFDRRLLDPAGERQIVAIARSCEGFELVIRPTATASAGVAAASERRIPIAPEPPPSAARCPEMPPGFAADDGGYVVLGWAPSGIVLARGAQVTIAPLDAEGAPTEPARILDEATPLPAPLPEGMATRDAHAYALALPFGIVVVDRAARAVRIYRDEEFAVPAGRISDVALSPSGERAAWLCGDAICWANLRAELEPPLPATRPPDDLVPEGQRQGNVEAPPTQG